MARYNKQSLVEDLLLHDIFANVPKSKTTQFVEDLLDIVTERVAAGDEVNLAGFGKLRKVLRSALSAEFSNPGGRPDTPYLP